jgi:hypothetical protein
VPPRVDAATLKTAHLTVEILGARGAIVFDDDTHPPAPVMIFKKPTP